MELSISGSSKFPILSWISEAVKVDTATGVFLSIAKSTVPKTVIPSSSLALAERAISPKLNPELKAISLESYPT